ncbi:hypothetical protein [Vibrio salinus]|uniref:hypothetical protein n=1 Tax=Vibrio salinus TaxID=2899784 RepID=UPI001E344824|nr:hypothetical protein [Vibrio salinus]MCE0494632.1 hypothetical protein [Vibrio salinus]
MKKIKITVAVGVFFALTTSVFAASDNNYIDLAGNDIAVGIAIDQGLSAVLELNDQVRVTAGTKGLALDYILTSGWFSNPDLPVEWYVGAGGWSLWDDDDYGARLPVGLNWSYTKNVSFYGQLQPQYDFGDDDEFELGVSAGITYRF